MKIKFSVLSAMVILSMIIYGCKKEPTKPEDIKVKSVEASSTLDISKTRDYSPQNLVDGSRRSWCEGKDGDGAGETVKIVFEKKVVIAGLFIRNGFGDSEYFSMNGRVKDIEVKASDGTTVKSTLKDSQWTQEIKFDKLVETGDLLIKINSAYSGSKWKDTCLSEISFDKKKSDSILSLAQACKNEGKSYEFGACIPAVSPVVAVMNKISPMGEFKSDINSIPDFCGKEIYIQVEEGFFDCGYRGPRDGSTRIPNASGKCKKLSPNEIQCTINKCVDCEWDTGILRIKKHEIYDNVLEIHDGPYSFWLEKR